MTKHLAIHGEKVKMTSRARYLFSNRMNRLFIFFSIFESPSGSDDDDDSWLTVAL
jgi:hypothetical protein